MTRNNYTAAEIDTTVICDEEYFEKGKSFVEELKKIAEEHKPYFGHNQLFMSFENLVQRFQLKLKQEERWAE